MGFTEEYKPLFQLHLLHNFHLASGGTAYDHTKLPDAFSNHHVKEYATIIPTQKTVKSLQNYKILIQNTVTGIIAYVKVNELSEPFIALEDLNLEFLVYCKDPLFQKYTKFYQTNNVYHFRYGIGAGKNKIDKIGQEKASLLREFAVPFAADENSEYQQLIKDIPLQQRVSLMGVVNLDVRKLLSNKGKVLYKETQFKIVFESRALTWVYVDSQDQEVFRTSKKLPFVKNGTIKVMDDNANFYRMASPKDIVKFGEVKIYV